MRINKDINVRHPYIHPGSHSLLNKQAVREMCFFKLANHGNENYFQLFILTQCDITIMADSLH